VASRSRGVWRRTSRSAVEGSAAFQGPAMRRCVFNVVLALFAWASGGFPAFAQANWPTQGGSSARAGTGTFFPPSLASPRWVATHDCLNRPITFDHHAGPVTWGDLVIAVGRVAGHDHLLAFDWWTGVCQWATPIPSRVLNSWSTPTIDAENGTVLVASGASLSAYNLADGSFCWRADLFLDVVNASPCVTGDLGPARPGLHHRLRPLRRRLIALLHQRRPLGTLSPTRGRPGDIVWQAPIGSASGATPAYLAGRAYVAVAGEFSFGPGRIHAFTAEQSGPAKARMDLCQLPAFRFLRGRHRSCRPWGHLPLRGVLRVLRRHPLGKHGQGRRLDRRPPLEHPPAGAPSSTPVVVGDGRIVLSSGVLGFGSAPEVALFLDLGTHATRLWSTALNTWIDVDQDNRLDVGEFMLAGGSPPSRSCRAGASWWGRRPRTVRSRAPMTPFW
jgi:hypothetical protein